MKRKKRLTTPSDELKTIVAALIPLVGTLIPLVEALMPLVVRVSAEV